MTPQEKEKMFLDLNSVLVKFWIEQGRPDKEVRIELLERMLNWYKKMGYVTLDETETHQGFSHIPETCKENQDSFTNGLEEAAEEYALLFEDGSKWKDGGKYKGFIAGAEWQKEQMMKEAVEGEIGYWNQRGLSIMLDQSLEKLGYDEDTKVKIIIIKDKEARS